MADLLIVPVDAGGDVLVFEVDRAQVADELILAAAQPGEIAERARVTLEEALSKLKPALDKIVQLLKALSPDQTAVEFGLKIGGETGVIVAKGTAEVNFVVRVSWNSE
jgi:hypothetical protein